jgi:hypothetical protein
LTDGVCTAQSQSSVLRKYETVLQTQRYLDFTAILSEVVRLVDTDPASETTFAGSFQRRPNRPWDPTCEPLSVNLV